MDEIKLKHPVTVEAILLKSVRESKVYLHRLPTEFLKNIDGEQAELFQII